MAEEGGNKPGRGEHGKRGGKARSRPKSRARAHADRAVDRANATTARARAFAVRARAHSVARVRDLGVQARDRFQAAQNSDILEAHFCFVQSPRKPITPAIMNDTVRVATYNVHRWQGVNGRSKPDVARAGYVISELDADVIALQEVLRPFAPDASGISEVSDGPSDANTGRDPGTSMASASDDALERLCDELDLHLAFAVTRQHRRGQLGNAILSRYPITAISVIDISYSRIERRGALAARVGQDGASLGIVATHLSLVDRTRHRQVQSLLEHPQMNSGPAVLMGDMNAWRKCKGSKELEESLNLHHNVRWPASFPAARPMWALDRIYSQGADVLEVRQHDSAAARKASDHLPVVAEVRIKDAETLT